MEIVRTLVFLLVSCIGLSHAVYHPIAKTPNACSKQHSCHKLAHCIPQHYSFKCVCMPGFFGNGQFCTRFPACTRNPCPAGSSCLPGFLGGFRCVCNFGFYRVGRVCVSAQSCQFRCGRPYNPLFPCQCGPKCALYGLCCQDFALQCPRVTLTKPPTPKSPYGQIHGQAYGNPHKPLHHQTVTHPPSYGFATKPPVHKPSYVHTTPALSHYPNHHATPVQSHYSHSQSQNKFPFLSSFPHQGSFASQSAHSQPEFQAPIIGFVQPQQAQFEPAAVSQQSFDQGAGHPGSQPSQGNQIQQATFVQAPVIT